MKPSEFHIETVVNFPFEQNTYIAWIEGRADCIVIDPGFESNKIIDRLEKLGLEPAAFLNTHGHGDHIGGNKAMKQRWPGSPLVIGTDDAEKLTDSRLNLSDSFGVTLISPEADATVNDGDVYEAAGIELQIRAIPGHSAGHVVFLWNTPQPARVFVGDVIFAGSIGRTDFHDGDHGQLISGIRSKLFDLPDDTVLLPGHGPETTVGEEKQTNPYVGI